MSSSYFFAKGLLFCAMHKYIQLRTTLLRKRAYVSQIKSLFKKPRSSRPEVFCKKDVLRNYKKFTGKNLRQSLFFNKVANLRPYERKTHAQVFSCEFCEISKNTFSHRTSPVAASESQYFIP